MLRAEQKKKLPNATVDINSFSAEGENISISAISATFSAPEWVLELSNEIDTLKKELYAIFEEDLLQTYLNINLAEMQQKVDHIINGDTMQNLLKHAEDTCGVISINNDEYDPTNLLDDKLYVQIIRDEHSGLLKFAIKINNLFAQNEASFDLRDYPKKQEQARNNPQSIPRISFCEVITLSDDITQLSDNVQSSRKKLHCGFVADFNTKWKDKAALTLIYNPQKTRFNLEVKDTLGNIFAKAAGSYSTHSSRFFSMMNDEESSTSSDSDIEFSTSNEIGTKRKHSHS